MDLTAGAGALVFGMGVALQAALRARARTKTLERISPAVQTPTVRWFSRAERGGIDDDLALAARGMARAIRGGSSPAQAMAAAAHESPQLPDLATCAQRAGESGLTAACRAWRRCDDRAGVRLITAALELNGSAGGSLARALDGVADTIEARAAVRREVRAQAATARASAAVLVVAPVAFAGFSLATDSAALAFLTGTPAGLVCLLVAIGLDAGGATWMAKITKRAA